MSPITSTPRPWETWRQRELCTCPRHQRARTPWQRINQARVRELALHMGLTRPVAIYRGMPDWYTDSDPAGLYDMLSNPEHDIYLHSSLSARGARYVLIHELQHAVQRESWERRGIPSRAGAMVSKLEEQFFGYNDCPNERDANARADALADEFSDLVS